MSNLRLYDRTDQYHAAVESCIDPETGELDMDRFERIQAESQEAITTKAANTACYIRELEAESAAIGQVIAAQLQRCKALDSRAKRLRDYLLTQMEVSSLPAISDPRIQVKLRKNPASVQIQEVEAIPSLYCRVVPARYEPDKAAIKEAIKNGEDVPGASLVQTTRLEIK